MKFCKTKDKDKEKNIKEQIILKIKKKEQYIE